MKTKTTTVEYRPGATKFPWKIKQRNNQIDLTDEQAYLLLSPVIFERGKSTKTQVVTLPERQQL